MLKLTLGVLLLAACSSSTGGSTCGDGGRCACYSGAECRPGLTCAVDADWKVLDCTCSSANTFTCATHVKPNGPCESPQYCNRGVPSCQAETATCQHDCRCEYTTSPGQGVWLCQDNCGAAKVCPKVQPSSTACTLDPSVKCRYWSSGDTDVTCSCGSDAGAGLWSCSN